MLAHLLRFCLTGLLSLSLSWITKSKSWKIVEDSTFCKQSVMCDDRVKSINSVTAAVHAVTVNNGLLTDIRYY